MGIRRLFGVLLAGLLVVGFGAAPLGASSDVFTVRGIEVDVTAETAAAARETALAEGHVLAFGRLLARLLPRNQLTRVRQFKSSEIVQFVQDFEVADERRSDVRYLASLTFRFKPGPLRAMLRQDGLLYAETRSKPVLVLPVYGAAGEAALWDETNSWWSAWAGRRPGDWLVPLRMPLGDLGDISTIDAEQTLAGDSERLSRLAARYGTEDIVITQAVLRGDPEAGQAVLQVGTSRLGVQGHQTIIENYRQEPGEMLDDVFARAADAVDSALQESWKQRNLLRSGTEQTISATVPVRGLDDLLEVKRRLRGVAPVLRSELLSLSRDKSEFEITFVGDERQLVLAMAQIDLVLSLSPAVGWRLVMAGMPEADETPAAPASPAPAAETAPAAAPAGGAGQTVPRSQNQTTAPAATPVVE